MRWYAVKEYLNAVDPFQKKFLEKCLNNQTFKTSLQC